MITIGGMAKLKYLPVYVLIILTTGAQVIENHYQTELDNQTSSDGLINDKDKECIGNRAEASESGRQCSRRCRKDMPCENSRKQCLCDGLCGLSCLKPDLSCPVLPKIENGDFFPKTTVFNTKVIYQCDAGYYLFGSRERLCQGDEEWSGTQAECLAEALCRDPIKVNHARNPNDGTYRLNDKINYSCYPGYHTRGSSEAVCKLIEKNQTAWVWAGQSPFRCIPKNCGDPGQIENGKRLGEFFTISSSVQYTCNSGFDLIGQARRYCQSDNQWSGQQPHCEPVTCNPTDHLDNGKINYVYPLVFNSTVEYTCDFGFRLVGPAQRTCGPERKLIGDISRCEEIDCGELGPLNNGRIVGSSSRMGDRKEFTCDEGMKFKGESSDSVCQETGKWSHPLPKCFAPCQVPQIEQATSIYVIPDELTNGNANRSATNITLQTVAPGSLVAHGTFLELVCENQYELDEQMDGDSVMRAPMCNNSSWSYIPKCRPASCKSMPPCPKNGRLRVASIEHGARGHIHCLDGYKLKGDSIVHCNKGNWSRIDSSCIEIYCSFPGSLEHGRVLLVGLTGMYDYKPYITRTSINRQIAYECEVGYHMNDGAPSGATCIDGLWKPEGLPSCIKE